MVTEQEHKLEKTPTINPEYLVWREKVIITLIGLVGVGISLTVFLFKLM